MFEKDAESKSTITRIDGKGRFIDVTQWFAKGKILFTFCTYDETRPKGNRITQEIKCYLNIEEAALLANICESGRFVQIGMRNHKEFINAKEAGFKLKYPKAIFEKYGGTSKGPIVAKRLSLSMKEPGEAYAKNLPFTLRADAGEGKVVDKGAIRPIDGYSNYVIVGLTEEQVFSLGIQIKRAIAIYDHWIALGVLDEKVKELEYQGNNRQNNGYNNNNNGYRNNNYNNNNNGYNANNTHQNNHYSQHSSDNNRSYSSSQNQQTSRRNNNETTHGYVSGSNYTSNNKDDKIHGRVNTSFNTSKNKTGRVSGYVV